MSGLIGECAGSPQFTHASEDDFRIIRDNLAGGDRSTRDRLVPYCMFTDPPLAHVGLNEAEAKRQGVAARVAKLPMKAVRRTRAASRPGTPGIAACVPISRKTLSPTSTRVPPSLRRTSSAFGATKRPVP